MPPKTFEMLDPFASHSPEKLKKRGLGVIREFVTVVEARADATADAYGDAAAALPDPWRAVALLGRVVVDCEDGVALPEVVKVFAEVDDRTLLLRALKEIGEQPIARMLSAAEELVADDPVTWEGTPRPTADDLVRLKKKLFVLVGTMDEALPPAER